MCTFQNQLVYLRSGFYFACICLVAIEYASKSIGDETVSDSDKRRAEYLVDNFVANSIKLEKYGTVGIVVVPQFGRTAVDWPTEVIIKFALLVDAKKRYEKFSVLPEFINEGKLKKSFWRTYIRSEGKTLLHSDRPSKDGNVLGDGLELDEGSMRVFPQLEPFETTIGDFRSVLMNECRSGFLISKFDREKVIEFSEVGPLEIVHFQSGVKSRETICFDRDKGSQPVYFEIRASDSIVKPNRDVKQKDGYGFYVSNTTSDWTLMNDVWLPVSTTITSCQSTDKKEIQDQWEIKLDWVTDRTEITEQLFKSSSDSLYEQLSQIIVKRGTKRVIAP